VGRLLLQGINSSNIVNAGSREFNFPTETKKHDIGEGVIMMILYRAQVSKAVVASFFFSFPFPV
jgi:hypothetical protein